MEWIEISLDAAVDQAEAVAEVLRTALGEFSQGVSIEQQGILPDRYDDGDVPPPSRVFVRAYLQSDARAEQIKADIEVALAHMNLLPEYHQVDDQNWAEAWKAHYHPLRIGKKIVVRPLWETAELQPGDIEIALDPGMAFGTGTHATTQLCLAALEDVMRPGLNVLDLGCGSGILAIAAAKMGAAKLIAVDIDPLSVQATDENAAVNGVADKISAYEGSLETVLGSARRFDLLLANILAKIIIEMCDQRLGQVVRPGGQAIFSGIITEQVDDVKAALIRTGLTPTEVRQDGDWVAILASRLQD